MQKNNQNKISAKLKRFITKEEKLNYTDNESEKIKLISRRIEIVKNQVKDED